MKAIIVLLASLTTLSAQPDRFGLPDCSAPDQQLAGHTFFLLCHSSTGKVALWTAHELTSATLTPNANRPSHFRRDPLVTTAAATNNDYRNSGLSRGHLVPAADFASSQSGIRETFFLSNAVPQYQEINAGPWRRIENAVRELASGSDALYIVTGVLFESAN